MFRPSVRTSARTTARASLVAGITVLLLGLAAPPTAGGEAGRLPPCPPAGAAGGAPAHPPALADPAACRAEPTRVEPAGVLPVPRPGYHHLGATTAEQWNGIQGRLGVRSTGVRAGTRDFVATRFLAVREPAGGGLAWLEVGWATTGWSPDQAPRVYAFDSASMSWSFFDDYLLHDGDQIWVHLHAEAGGWRAWLWWGGRWRLLSAPDLPTGGQEARLEQYVEVHRDGAGPPVAVPPVQVDQVQVATAGGQLVPWRPDRVATVGPALSGDYCLTWQHQFDAWSAGDCPAH